MTSHSPLSGVDLAPATVTGTCYGPCGDVVNVGDLVIAGDAETPLIHAGCYVRMHTSAEDAEKEAERREAEKQAEARHDALAYLNRGQL